MPFDPTLPIEGTPLDAAQMRDQLNGLADLIDEIPAGPEGPPGPTGPQGEVTINDLSTAINGTARNPTSVSPLFITPDSTYDPAQLQAVIDRLNDLITAARREA